MSASNSSAILISIENTSARAATGKQRWEQLRRSAGFLLALTAALVIAADVLFYKRHIGVTLAIFAVLLAGAVSLRSARFLRHWPGRIIAIAFLGLCLTLAEHPGPLRITMAALALFTIVILNTRRFGHDVPLWIGRWSELVARMFYQAPRDVIVGRRWRRGHGDGPSQPERFMRRWTIPIALSLIFIALFALANPIISNWISRASREVGRFLTEITEYVAIGRIFLWAIVGGAVWGLLRGRPRLRSRWTERVIADDQRTLLSDSLLIRCLALFNIVFALQLALDLATVLSAGTNLPEGMTYSEYARRGAYPLVATALLAAGFVLVTFPSGARQAASLWSRRLVYLWIGQNIVLTGTAVWRLWMYVDAFGLTRLRVAAAIWMLLVALGLCYIIWRIVREKSNAWLLRINFMTLIAVLYLCCFVNFDRLIAWHGVGNSYELRGHGQRADLNYLHHLGADAIPTLEWLAAQLGPEHSVGAKAAEHAATLRRQLADRLQTWHGWTWRRHRLIAQPVEPAA